MVALFSWLVHPAASETSQGSWQSPGSAHQQCRFWLSPCSLLTWILTPNFFFPAENYWVLSLFFFFLTGAAASAVAASCVEYLWGQPPQGMRAGAWDHAPGFLKSWGGGGQGPHQALSGTCFSAVGQLPQLCAHWSCHSWWAHVVPSPPLQGHLST